MIRSLLIANRGEIAVRIARTCRRLGIRSIAVFSDADRDAPHVKAADEAFRIGPSPARDSYLRADAIMEACRRAGADAVHPGYGFLSEKPELPTLCAAEGIVFVGPSADRIAAMGPKIGSKLIAAGAGVPSVPGYVGDDQSDARLLEEAKRTGFPLMVKASAGGGGRGMRRVFSEAELAPALEIARREAEAAFGDSSLLIEKLVLRPRHLEVQIAGDKHGNVVHLFERDCSVQRKNQKLLEEAPADSYRMGLPLRLPVQMVNRPQTKELHDFRGYMGRIETGSIEVGQKIAVYPSGLTTTVADIYVGMKKVERAEAPASVTITFADQRDVSRGDLIVAAEAPPQIARRIAVDLIWLDRAPLDLKRGYLVKHGARTHQVKLQSLDNLLDVTTLATLEAEGTLGINEIGRVVLRLASDLPFDPYETNRATGALILIDPATNATVAGGIIRGAA